jgi:hypothetical protein
VAGPLGLRLRRPSASCDRSLVVHEGIPDSGPTADNETGTRMALANLARSSVPPLGRYWRAMCTRSSASGSSMSFPLTSTVTLWMMPVNLNGLG